MAQFVSDRYGGSYLHTALVVADEPIARLVHNRPHLGAPTCFAASIPACVIDTANDPHEISLDENVTREAMHPADQFEAFRQLAEERGFGAEEIAARFGVTASVVRQRMRLGAVSPRLMQVYRDDGLSLDQLMAFAMVDDFPFLVLRANKAALDPQRPIM